MDQIQSNGHGDSCKQSSFHSTYTLLCKEKNVPAILELIKSKTKLDFVADRIRSDQWDMIFKSLEADRMLELLAIRCRKSSSLVYEQTESAKRFNIMTPLVRAVSGCVKRNFAIAKLALEGLQLTVAHIQTICNAITRNNSLKSLSFSRSSIMDDGCNIISSTIRNLPKIEKLNLSQCCLTATGAHHISELIKFQTMSRNSEGWMQSLRYRDVDVDSVPGLKCLILNGNQLRDEGLEIITSKLKEDMWIKAIEVQNCELTDVGGEAVLDCLKFNKTLVVFDASHNYKISHKIHKKIQMILSAEPDNYETIPKVTNSDLREKIEFLEQRLQLETFNRERADDLNVQLHQRLVKLNEETVDSFYELPSGYTMIESDELNALYKEIEDLAAKEERCTSDGKDMINTTNGVGVEQSGFGDTLASPERKTYASFIPFCQESTTIELNTSVSFTPYSEESSCDNSSKFDDDEVTVNSHEENVSALQQQSVFEEYIGFDQFNQEIFGDGEHEKTLVCERNDLFGTKK